MRHLEREAQAVETRVHRLVEDRGRDLRRGERRVHRERQLDEARPLVGDVRAAAGVALHEDAGEIPRQPAEVVRHMTLDQSQRFVEPAQHVVRSDVGS